MTLRPLWLAMIGAAIAAPLIWLSGTRDSVHNPRPILDRPPSPSG